MKNKVLIVGIILLFVGASAASGYQITSSPKPLSRGWLYVGGSGPGNYTTIQSAINDANDGDTIFVYHGTYYEHDLVISQLNLIGEDKNTTIIDGHEAYLGILAEDGATVRGFTIRGFTLFNSGIGISINGNKVTISDNIITGCSPYGIYIGTTWVGNSSNSCSIHDNYFISNTDALTVRGGTKLVSIDHNQFENNSIGIVARSTRAIICCNNLINNNGHVLLNWETTLLTLPFVFYRTPSFRENYWDDWSGEGPRVVHGHFIFWIYLPSVTIGVPLFHIVQFDWHPAQEPYDIPKLAI